MAHITFILDRDLDPARAGRTEPMKADGDAIEARGRGPKRLLDRQAVGKITEVPEGTAKVARKTDGPR